MSKRLVLLLVALLAVSLAGTVYAQSEEVCTPTIAGYDAPIVDGGGVWAASSAAYRYPDPVGHVRFNVVLSAADEQYVRPNSLLLQSDAGLQVAGLDSAWSLEPRQFNGRWESGTVATFPLVADFLTPTTQFVTVWAVAGSEYAAFRFSVVCE